MTNTNQKTSPDNEGAGGAIEILTGEINDLHASLDKGWDLLEKETDPERYKRYEAKWFGYLRKYEAKCQQRRDLGYVYPGK
jgi:hypothetical protein